MPKAEKTWPNRGCGSGSAWLIVSRHESARASTESRLSRTPTITQRQETKSKAWYTVVQSGPRHQIATIAADEQREHEEAPGPGIAAELR